MSTSTVDSKKRIVLPKGRPGEVFDIQEEGEGRFLLVRLQTPKKPKINKKACLDAMRRSPLSPMMEWEDLRELTREL